MRTVMAIVLAAAVPLAFAACKSGGDQPKKCESCEKAKSANGWCADCKVGFRDGEKMKCPSCHAAATGKGGWCDGCGKGYKGGKETKCKGCAEAAATGGTCPT
ncbi:MAG: hypothetical protein HYY17_16920 [Planctomycetes bacterium]|nr:hypothetical protein [Planctomycetota bacterium]